MGTSAPPAPGGEAPAAGAPPVAPAAPTAPQKSAVQTAVDKARVEQKVATGTPVAPVAVIPANETPEQKVEREEDDAILAGQTPEQKAALDAEDVRLAAERAAETPEQRTAREAAAAEIPPERLVTIAPRREGEEPFELELESPEAAELVRAAIRGSLRAEQANEIRDQAQAIRDEAERINYAVELDPAGLIVDKIQTPQDLDHLFRFIATRPGVIERMAVWVADMIEKPETIKSQAELAQAERITRKEAVSEQVETQSRIDDNARAIARTIDKSIESLLPDSFTDEARARFRQDIFGDCRQYCREKNLLTMDTRHIPGFIQSRLSYFGVAPRKGGQPPAAPPVPAAKPAVASAPQPTVEQIRAARQRRAAAGSAPPGAGSPSATGVPKPPPYDPNLRDGSGRVISAIKQAGNAARRFIGKGSPQ